MAEISERQRIADWLRQEGHRELTRPIGLRFWRWPGRIDAAVALYNASAALERGEHQ
jgi:hypothetical protein